MAERQTTLPILTEEEWGMVLRALSLGEDEEKRSTRTLSGLSFLATGRGLSSRFSTPNDITARWTNVKSKILSVRASIKTLEQDSWDRKVDKEIDLLLSEGEPPESTPV
jgi:hypothetical protein